MSFGIAPVYFERCRSVKQVTFENSENRGYWKNYVGGVEEGSYLETLNIMKLQNAGNLRSGSGRRLNENILALS